MLGKGFFLKRCTRILQRKLSERTLIVQAYRSDDAIESLKPQLDLVGQILKRHEGICVYPVDLAQKGSRTKT